MVARRFCWRWSWDGSLIRLRHFSTVGGTSGHEPQKPSREALTMKKLFVDISVVLLLGASLLSVCSPVAALRTGAADACASAGDAPVVEFSDDSFSLEVVKDAATPGKVRFIATGPLRIYAAETPFLGGILSNGMFEITNKESNEKPVEVRLTR